MKPRILLVDDEEMYLEYLSKRLINRGYDVTKCLTGEEALQRVKTDDFDVIILDVLLPGIDGIETLREINTRKPLSEVIMLTGHTSLESGVEGMRLGAFDYLRKPCNTEELVSKIDEAYHRKISQEERIRKASQRYQADEEGQ